MSKACACGPQFKHHKIQSVGDILLAVDCHPINELRLIIHDPSAVDWRSSNTETVFIPLGNQLYTRIFRDIYHQNCHPITGYEDGFDITELSSFQARIYKKSEVVKHIAHTFYEYAEEPGIASRVFLHIGNNDVYEEGEDFEHNYEKEMFPREEVVETFHP